LHLGDTVATNSCPLLFTHLISTIISVPLDMVNSLHLDNRYLCIPVMDPGISSCFNSIAAEIRSAGTRGSGTLQVPTICLAYLMEHHSMSLVGAHAWVKSCHPILQPKNGFWQQLIHHKYKLFSV
ncbi:Dual specificity protein phosphatase 18, partial [Antrostomus carolinensis]